MNVLVLYHSRKGHTRKVAEAIGQAVRSRNCTAKVKSVIEAQKTDIESADVLFIGTWVQGFILFGVKPAEAKLWVPALPSLAGKPTGIFCTYAFNPRSSLDQLGALLADQGATIVGRSAFHRRHPDQGIDQFVQDILQSAGHGMN